MRATIVITTKNRKQELAMAVRSALEQTANAKVLVIDDGSTDGTSEMIRSDFPDVRLDRVEKSQGLIVHRNRAAHLANGDILFSIDDDAIFSTPRVVEQTLAEFDHPRVGAVAIPFKNVNQSDVLYQRADGEKGIVCGSDYIGTAHALRQELFLQLGGYREYLFHQGEEGDYCIRLLNAGYVVRLGRADPIHHFESPRRDFRRMDRYGWRNNILFAWYNVPWPAFPVRLLGTTARGVAFGFRVGRPWRMLRGLASGWLSIPREWRNRHPVSPQTYKLYRRLKRAPQPLNLIEPLLSPPQH